MSATTIEARQITKAFSGPPLFSGLSFRAEAGLLAVRGRNGSGKTTLLKILASLAHPSSGSVSVRQGEQELSGDARRLAVGWSGPDLAFYEDFSALENLLFLSRAGGQPRGTEDLTRRLAEVGLAEAMGKRVGAFSTGMKQRLKIVFALLFDPPALLLDEPMIGLDTDGRAIVERVVAVKRREGLVILASNDPRDFVEPEQTVELGRETGNGKRKTVNEMDETPDSSFPVSRLPFSGSSAAARAWAICAKDAAQELRRRVAVASIFFFAATAVTLVSFGIGPFGLPPEARDKVCSALLWIILFFCAATGLPRAFVREEETGTAFALRKVAPASLTLAGKTLFNYLLFLAIAAVSVPAFSILLEWHLGSPGGLAALLILAGYGLSIVSTFLAALVARASQKNVLFVVISFPLLLPLLLSAIVATVEAAGGSMPSTPLRVIVAYDGAATCASYLLASAAWED